MTTTLPHLSAAIQEVVPPALGKLYPHLQVMVSYSRDHRVAVLVRLVSYQLRNGEMFPQFLSATATGLQQGRNLWKILLPNFI
jgi:hypothetical protein